MILNIPVNAWWYLFLFILVFLEGIPALGFFSPGQLIVLITGFFVKQGSLNFGLSFIVIFLAAFVSDLSSFILGRKFGISFLSRGKLKLFISAKHISKTKNLFKKHSAITIIASRFNSLTRSFGPFIGGSSGLKLSKFVFLNLLGSFSWSLFYLLLGFLFWNIYGIISKYINEIIIVSILAIVFLVYLYKLANKKKTTFTKHHFFLFFINFISIYVLFRLLYMMHNKILIAKSIALQNYFLNQTFSKTSELFIHMLNPYFLFIVVVVLFLILCHNKNRINSFLFLLMILSTLGFGSLLSSILNFNLLESSFILFIVLILSIFYFFKEDFKNKIIFNLSFFLTSLFVFLIALLLVVSGKTLILNIIIGFLIAVSILSIWVIIFIIIRTYFPKFSKFVRKSWRHIC